MPATRSTESAPPDPARHDTRVPCPNDFPLWGGSHRLSRLPSAAGEAGRGHDRGCMDWTHLSGRELPTSYSSHVLDLRQADVGGLGRSYLPCGRRTSLAGEPCTVPAPYP